uniref:Probable WRKY transcription factor protein 1 n=1 Tax=Dermatophagoides pteronyssinus TaxID=6956 RepID=A0A6P6YMC9_DERPT|nr:probable WRKY transcription factor protein 1 [Dermatophagoides pteronyssinus]XP_027206170.1 probable WRKY transcription factor protein 1 [Dermatophagoides pteronyssinus]
MNPDKKEKQHRHTIPNSNYPSFPSSFYQEEIELKTTNLIDDNNNNIKTTTNDDVTTAGLDQQQSGNQNNDGDIEFSMQDKLQMCFSEMQNLKDHFDKRRRRFPSLKKKTISNSTTIDDDDQIDSQPTTTTTTTKHFQSKSNQTNPDDHDDDDDHDGSKFKAHLIRTRSKDSIDNNGDDRENVSKIFSHKTTINDRSKRSISDPFNLVSRDGVQTRIFTEFKPTFQSTVGPNQDLNKTTVNKMKQQQGFNEWLSKLEEINDMSRSTIDRIRRLENDIFQLRNTTANNEKQFDSTSTSTSTKTSSSKIPIHQTGGTTTTYVPPIDRNRIRKIKNDQQNDKSQNTDIDMEFMNKLLKYWETHVGYPIDSSINNKSTTSQQQQQQQQRRTNNQLKDPIRRLTTTISRSVQIQTDSDGKSFEEKGVTTDNNNHFDLKQQIFHHHHHQPKSSSALNHGENDNFKPNLPIIEKPMIAKTINTFHVCSDNKTDNILIDLDPLSPLSSQQQQQPQPRQSYRSPEPIVEMYSDSDDDDDVVEDDDDDDNEDDTYFDNFEKDIFNEISRRAMIRNKIITRSRSAQQLLPTRIEDTTNLLKNSGTQTKNLKRDNNNVRISETPSTMGTTTATTTTSQKRMQSTSKIIIERQTQNNQKEKREIIIQTDIDHDGKVHRTTEIRNCKQKNMLPMIDMIKIENECFPPTTLPSSLMMMTNDDRTTTNNDNIPDDERQERRRQQKKKNVSNEKMNDIFPRTQSAFDLMMTDNNNNENMILGKTDNDYLSNKAFSSLDIRSLTKSPVISEGYHSERLDSSTQIHHHNQRNHQHTPESDRQQYIIEPPESYCQTPEYSSNNMNNTWIMNNETLIENSGKEMNITTKSSTIRKPTEESKSKSQTQIRKSPINMNYIDDDDDSPKQQQQQSRSRSAKTTAQTYVPTAAATTTTTTYRNPNDNLNECKFSFVCNNNGTNIVFRADFGISKLPLFETNL